MKLEGGTAIVTGAGNGIGKAIAIERAADGAKVEELDLNREKAEQTTENHKSRRWDCPSSEAKEP